MTTRADGKSYYQANRTAELARGKAYREAHREEAAAYGRAYREANAGRAAAYSRARYQAHRPEALATAKANREANREESLAYNKAHYHANREEALAYSKAYREANKLDISAKRRVHYEANKLAVAARSKAGRQARQLENLAGVVSERQLKVRARHRAQHATRIIANPEYRILKALRSRIRHALKRGAASKAASTQALTGCTVQELVAHLEGKFLPGMSWENRSAWHVDHQRPCSSFDLTDPEQQRACFHFSNLQPLWAADNLRKSRSWEPLKYFAAAADDISRQAGAPAAKAETNFRAGSR